MDMHSGFLPGEEKEPEIAVLEYGRAHVNLQLFGVVSALLHLVSLGFEVFEAGVGEDGGLDGVPVFGVSGVF